MRWLAVGAALAGALWAQTPYYAGVIGGIATLSADGGSVVTAGSAAISSYKPENGPAVNVFAGADLREYLSVQANWIWNRNELVLWSAVSSAAGAAFYEQARRSSQHGLFADLMVHFRERRSRVRPYLSAGGGVARLRSGGKGAPRAAGGLAAPAEIISTEPALRVAVGIDVIVRPGWAFRYSFSETMRQNPISALLQPPGTRGLANFQNLFGFVRRF